MKHPNKIDDIFRQRLHDAQVPPPPFVWSAVEYELNKRRSRWPLWLFAFGILAMSGVIWQASQQQMIQGISENSPAKATPNYEQLNITAGKENTQESNFKETSGQISSSTSGKQPFLKASVLASSKRNQSVTTKQETNLQALSKISSVKHPAEQHLLSEFIDKQVPTNSDPLYLPIPDEDRPLIRGVNIPIATPEAVISMSQAGKDIPIKDFKSPSRRKKAKPKLCYDFARHPSAWLVDVYAGPSLAQRSLTSRLDDEPYLNQRLATEKRSAALNAGVRASLMFNRNFLVRTGLHYDQITEVFEYIDPTFVITSINKIYVNGQFMGVDTVVTYGANLLKTYNRYAMLDVPFLVGVEMRSGRSGFSINAGLSANVLFQKRGVIIDPLTQEPARFGLVPEKPKNIGPNASLSQAAFRPSVGLSATASVQWYWHITPQMRLFAEPSFRQVLRPVSLASHPVEQRYSILGLRLGATRIF